MKAKRLKIGGEVIAGAWFNAKSEYADGSGHFIDEKEARSAILQAMWNTERFNDISLGSITIRLATPKEAGKQPLYLKGKARMLVGEATVT